MKKHADNGKLHAFKYWLMICVALIAGCFDDPTDVNQVSDGLTEVTQTAETDLALRKEPIRPLVPAKLASSEMVMLGKTLFHDVRLSRDNTISCASCHDIKSGGDDGRPVSIGVGNQAGTLNAPTVLNSSLSIAQFWDGRASSLSEQVAEPIHNPVEMGSSWQEVVTKLQKDKELEKQFIKVFNQTISKETLVEAIVCYEKALVTLDSAFDRYLRGDDAAINSNAKKGYDLFKSVGCIFCHQGQTVGGNMFQEFGVLENFNDHFDPNNSDSNGRFNVTKREVDLHRFKVPSLRNIEKTAPYFHKGNVKDLGEAIKIMAIYQLGESLEDREIELIREFLITLGSSVNEELK